MIADPIPPMTAPKAVAAPVVPSVPRKRISASPKAQPVHWTSWPMRDSWPKLWWMPLGVLGLAAAVSVELDSTACGIATAVVLALSLVHVWVPVHYRVASEAIEIRCLGTRRVVPWSQVIGVRWNAEQVTLWVRPVQGRLRPRPTTSIRLTVRNDQEEVIASLRARLAAAVNLRG